jgi:glycosyltransferase involved in cell wall biosynthesis
MRILIVLTYYRPHTSGLTIYAERLARALVERGHSVTVLTSRYQEALPLEEVRDGVRIFRVPVLFRLSKGVVMPSFGRVASRLVKEHDVIQLHLPQFDAAGVALRGRIFKKPTVITYHCDLRMPPGLLSWLANQAVRVMNSMAAFFTHQIVTYTRDYAENSSFLRRHLNKLKVIPPPVILPAVTSEEVMSFAKENNPQNRRPVIGMAARFASEKGVGVLLNALPEVLKVHPEAQVQFAGPYQDIIGEEHYFERLRPKIEKYLESGNWNFVGTLSPKEMAAFYPNIDVVVLPSLNSTEAFGLVQIEAMLNGAPAIASNLPGVRQPVTVHQMGKVVEIDDSEDLARALIEVLNNKKLYQRDPDLIAERYSPDSIAAAYENLFAEIKSKIG